MFWTHAQVSVSRMPEKFVGLQRILESCGNGKRYMEPISKIVYG